MSHQLNTKQLSSIICCLFLVLAGAVLPAVAQTAISEAPVSPERQERGKGKLPTTAEVAVDNANDNNTKDDREILELSPFTVNADADEGYLATSTLAGTRLRTDLRDVGSAITIVTKQFLRDTGSKNTQDLLVYTPSTEVGGLNGNFTGLGNGPILSERDKLVQPNNNNRVRGLSAADSTRDYFLSDIPWDAYNIDRVELQRGPNAILYGLGKPGGILNASQKQAGFKNLGSIEFRFDKHSSMRSSLDLNHVILQNELSIRVNALDDKTRYMQRPAFSHDRRIFTALRYDPSMLNRGSAHTSLRVNYEKGGIESNQPRTLPPADRITPFFGTLGKKVYDFRYNGGYQASVPGSGVTQPGSPNYNPAVTDLFGGLYAFYSDTKSGTQSGPLWVPYTLATEKGGIGPNGSIDGLIGGLFSSARSIMIANKAEIARNSGLPFAADYKETSLTDASVFDFYHKLLDGPNKNEWRNFEAINAQLSQTFWNNAVGFEAAFDHQRYDDGIDSVFNGGELAINVDINTLLPNQTPNPNVGRPMIISRTLFGGGGQETERTGYRITAFAELRAEKLMRKSWLTNILGRHVFTGVKSGDTFDRNELAWARYGLLDGAKIGLSQNLVFDREIQNVSYLGGDLRTATSASGLNLSNVGASQRPTSTSVVSFNSTWNKPINPALAGYVDPAAPWVNPFNNQVLTQSENPSNYVGWTETPASILDSANGDRRVLTTNARKDRQKIRSEIFVWQAFLFDGLVVPTFGYRKDTAKAYSVTAPITADRFADQLSASYKYPEKPYNEVSGATRSYSVVLHSPKFIRDRLPAGLNLDLFYNQSSNFEPAAGRTDALNRPVPGPTGKTKDYGFVVSMLNDRFILKVNKYESSAENAGGTWDSGFGVANLWLMGATESRAWVQAKKFEAGLSGNPLYAGPDYQVGSFTNGVFVQTAADRTRQAQLVKAVLDNFAPEIWTAWTMKADDARWQTNAYDPWGGGFAGYPPAGMSTLVDTTSKGYEYEATFRPVKGWDISINASKTYAARDNFAKNLVEWIEARNAVWSGLAGEIGAYGSRTTSIKDQWNQFFYNGYKLQTLLNGSAVPELRPWRFNLVTNYAFGDGRLKGFNVGGSYRWQDKVVIGYPSIKTTLNGESLDTYDITKPFMGPGDTNIDLWAGYQRKITKKITWRTQLNVRNVFGSNRLVPINVQPDGSAAAFRIKEGTSWSITNSLEF